MANFHSSSGRLKVNILFISKYLLFYICFALFHDIIFKLQYLMSNIHSKSGSFWRGQVRFSLLGSLKFDVFPLTTRELEKNENWYQSHEKWERNRLKTQQRKRIRETFLAACLNKSFPIRQARASSRCRNEGIREYSSSEIHCTPFR